MSPFRFLDLPDELRLKIYRFMLPHGERIHLDPQRVIFPIPYVVPESYGSTNLLRVCSKIHVEATQFIYRHNTVNIIATTEEGNFLENLGSEACENITKLECHVKEGLSDLGHIWDTISHHCPRLSDLRLVFYHEAVHWSRTLEQLAYYLVLNKDKENVNFFNLDVELHSSIWAPRRAHAHYATQFQADLTRAKRHAKVFSFDVPSQLRHITITASVCPNAAEAFEEWEVVEDEWEFRSFANTDTEMKKTMRLTKLPKHYL